MSTKAALLGLVVLIGACGPFSDGGENPEKDAKTEQPVSEKPSKSTTDATEPSAAEDSSEETVPESASTDDDPTEPAGTEESEHGHVVGGILCAISAKACKAMR